MKSTVGNEPFTDLEIANVREALRELKLFVAGIPDDASALTLHSAALEARARAWALRAVIQQCWNDSNSRWVAHSAPPPTRAVELDLEELGLL